MFARITTFTKLNKKSPGWKTVQELEDIVSGVAKVPKAFSCLSEVAEYLSSWKALVSAMSQDQSTVRAEQFIIHDESVFYEILVHQAAHLSKARFAAVDRTEEQAKFLAARETLADLWRVKVEVRDQVRFGVPADLSDLDVGYVQSMLDGEEAQVAMRKPIPGPKREISTFRRDYILRRYPMTKGQLKLLEAKYGKYLYIPLDLPKIAANDQDAFVSWYFENAKKINKVKSDVAGANYASDRTFFSVNSEEHVDLIWEQNPRADLNTLFPEIREQLALLPYKAVPEFMIWSSMREVLMHRDQTCWEDLPSSFRVMLYDENDKETLAIQEDRPGVTSNFPRLDLVRSPDTNSFAWNNLRSRHGSTYDASKRKILLIASPGELDLDRYEDLLERSVAKYGDLAHISDGQITDFATT